MNYGQVVNSAGLVLDILGGIMLFKFGLSNSLNPKGYQISYWNSPPEVEEEEARKYKRYKFRSDLAIWLVIIGFGFQLVGNFL